MTARMLSAGKPVCSPAVPGPRLPRSPPGQSVAGAMKARFRSGKSQEFIPNEIG